MTQEQLLQHIPVQEEQVQILRLHTGHFPVEHRIDIIGTALKRTWMKTSLFYRLQEAAGQQCLAASAPRRSKHDSGHPLFLMPGGRFSSSE